MPPNDSDSSDDDIEGYTTTKVLLGYASTEPTDDSFSRIGGLPVSPATRKINIRPQESSQPYRHGWIQRGAPIPNSQGVRSAAV